AEGDRIAFIDLHLGAVNDRVTLFFAPTVIDEGDRSSAVHHNQIARLRLDGLKVDELHRSSVLGIEARLLGDSRCSTTDVEGTHWELRSGLADGLGRDHADSLAQLDHAARGKVTAVAHDADTAFRLAGEHRADLHPLHTCGLNGAGQLFGDLLVDLN